MASSNYVELNIIKEVDYGITPPSGDFETIRFTSESLSGNPTTVESSEVRSDRFSSGQVLTGLEVSSSFEFELTPNDEALDIVFESAFHNEYQPAVADAGTLTISGNTITTDSDFVAAGFLAGEIVRFSGFANEGNNVSVYITDVLASQIDFIGPDSIVDEAGISGSVTRPEYLDIGITQISSSLIKKYNDLTSHGINYRGNLTGELGLNFAWGEISTGSIGLMGNGYQPADTTADFMTDGRTVNAPSTGMALNGSSDLNILITDESGIEQKAPYCIQTFALTMNNNLTGNTCLGTLETENYSSGTAQIEISTDIYLEDETFEFLNKKITQTPVKFVLNFENPDGGYALVCDSVQLNSDGDPSSGGRDETIVTNYSGLAKVGDLGENPLRMYKF